MMTIGGAGVAAFLIGNSMTVIKAAGGGMAKVFSGPKWKPSDYRDLLSLLFLLTKTMKSKGVIALESRSEEHTSELQSLMRISYAVFCLKKKNTTHNQII